MSDVRDEKIRIMIVGNHPDDVRTILEALPSDYHKNTAVSRDNTREILQSTTTGMPDLVLLDETIAQQDGYEICDWIKRIDQTNEIPVISFSSSDDAKYKIEALEHGVVDYITIPFAKDEFLARMGVHLNIHLLQKELAVRNQYLEQVIHEKAEEITEMQLSTIYALVKLTEYRDDIIGVHLDRTQEICKLIVEKLGEDPRYQDIIDPDFMNNVYKASPLHDIGKIGIPDGIYLKPGKLTPAEFEIMKKHTTIGAQTLRDVVQRFPNNNFIKEGINMALYHHERWDGRGYPEGLKGEEIPLSARIMAVADVFDALRTKRLYKEKFSHESSLTIILERIGTHFDPKVVEAFASLEDRIRQLYERN